MGLIDRSAICAKCGEKHVGGCSGHVKRCQECRNSVAKPLTKCPKCGSENLKFPAACIRRVNEFATRCQSHGMNLNDHIQATTERRELALAERHALKLLDRHEAPIDEHLNVMDQYDRALALAVAWLEVCQQQLEELTSASFETKAGDRKLDARINLWERALDRVEKFLSNAQHLDLEERRVRVTEIQKQQVAAAFTAALNEALTHLPPHQANTLTPLLPDIIRRHLNNEAPAIQAGRQNAQAQAQPR